jgi:hypothetical protein
VACGAARVHRAAGHARARGRAGLGTCEARVIGLLSLVRSISYYVSGDWNRDLSPS